MSQPILKKDKVGVFLFVRQSFEILISSVGILIPNIPLIVAKQHF